MCHDDATANKETQKMKSKHKDANIIPTPQKYLPQSAEKEDQLEYHKYTS